MNQERVYEHRYLYDAKTQEYRCAIPVSVGPGIFPPDNTTDIAPNTPKGHAAFWTGEKWEYPEDHRGASAYSTADPRQTLQVQEVGPIPADFTLIEPPQTEKGCAVVWGKKGWEQVEDHRGKVGYVAGEQVTVKALGPLPEGWSTEPPPPPPYEPPPDTRTPQEKRQSAYRAEADPIARQIEGYRLEAEAWQEKGEIDKAEECKAKADALLTEYLQRKQEIREQIPDTEGQDD